MTTLTAGSDRWIIAMAISGLVREPASEISLKP
jgi:hypothetical protein